MNQILWITLRQLLELSLQVGEREGSEWEQGTTWNKQAHENVNVQGTRGRVTDHLKKLSRVRSSTPRSTLMISTSTGMWLNCSQKMGFSARASHVQLNITSKLHWFFPLNLCFGLA
ncbi:uncharacterized protein [Malus domestica]|uniref:uncharacterized protein n=1 Tax=Malus domestica TaxID=3750 RepID=UPI0039753C2E